MFDTREPRPPIVTDADRQWALDQCPPWAIRAAPKANDWLAEPDPEQAPPARRNGVLIWDYFVTGEVERFERFFYDQRKLPADWSTLWRKSWWPKADPRKSYPSLVPPSPAGSFVRFNPGSDDFDTAWKLATPVQRAVTRKIGYFLFKADDPMVTKIRDAKPAPATLTERSLAMSGDRS